MRLIGKLAEQIEDELSGAEGYAKCAMEHKVSDRGLARMYASMAKTELSHAMDLHSHASKAAADAEKAGAAPSQEMIDTWAKTHEEMVERTAKVKDILAML